MVVMPRGLHARLCHAFLVLSCFIFFSYFVFYQFRRIKKDVYNACADGPVFVVEPRDQSADVGNQSATLSCLVDSRPPASMAWTLSSAPATAVLSHDETLVIRPVTERDFTSYRCTASVVGFKTVSRDVRLRRNGQPFALFQYLYLPISERSETGGDYVFTFVRVCVCLCALSSIGLNGRNDVLYSTRA